MAAIYRGGNLAGASGRQRGARNQDHSAGFIQHIAANFLGSAFGVDVAARTESTGLDWRSVGGDRESGKLGFDPRPELDGDWQTGRYVITAA